MTEKTFIKVDNPCPMIIQQTKNCSEYFCKSCNQNLIDFRNKTTKEIIQIISIKNACGIFNENQITIPNFSFKKKLLFKTMAILAIIGFNVRPINAQINPSYKDNNTLQKHNNEFEKPLIEKTSKTDTIPNIQKTKKWWHKKRKQKMKIIGTPSF